MEFPLMQGLFAAGRNAFGNSVFVMRIQCFMLSLLTLWGFSRLAAQVFRPFSWAARLGAWCLAFSPLFYYYAINPLPDNFALCMAVWSLCFLVRFIKEGKSSFWTLHLAFLSLSVLAKLPFITFFAASFIVLLPVLRKPFPVSRKAVLVVSLLLILPPLMWYLRVIPEWQNDGLKGGLFATKTPFSTLSDIAVHHLISTLPELIVNYASVLALLVGIGAGIKTLRQRSPLPLEKKALLAALGASLIYVIYELGMIGKEHDYYLFPLVPFILLTVVAGYKALLRGLFSGKLKNVLRSLAIVGLIVSPLTAWLRVQDRWNLEEPGFNADYYHYRNNLRTILPPDASVITGPDVSQFIHLYYLNRIGWTFPKSPLDKDFIRDKKLKGARFLITDSADAALVLPVHHPVRHFGSLVVAELP